MTYDSTLTCLVVSFTFGLALFFGIQASAQTTLEFDARLDAASVVQTFYATNFKYSGVSPGLRASFSFTSVNQFSPKTSYLYGISYASSGFNRGSNSFWCGNSFDHLDPEEMTEVIESMSYGKEQVEHISLPLGVRQTLKHGNKWTIYGQALLEPMVYFRTRYGNELWESNLTTSSERDKRAKNVQFATGLAAGFERELVDKWTFAFRPTFRMHLTKAAKNSGNIQGNARHLTTGIAVALGHSF